MKVKDMAIDKVIPYANNPRNNDNGVDSVLESIKEFGFQQPIVVDEKNVVIVGHTRLKAAHKLGLKTVPVVVADKLTPEQVQAYRLADNKTGELTEWDEDLLEIELSEIDELSDIDMSVFGFEDEIDIELDNDKSESDEEDNYENCENNIETSIKKGDVYRLGNHILMCGDSTSKSDVQKLMNGKVADLVFTDPPYGMKKENVGVTNDNLSYDQLLEFNKQWIPLTFDSLKSNGSWYCWGIDEPLMDIYANILKPMINKNELTFRNLITWDKGSAQGQNSESSRYYAMADEKCLFVVKGIETLVRNSDDFFEGYSKILEYLQREADDVNLTAKKYRDLTGNQMYGHYFTKSQWSLISRKTYNQLHQKFPNNFKKDYKELREEFVKEREKLNASLSYFDNAFDNFNNVWHFNRTSLKEREDTGGHATPKPIELCSRAIQASSRQNEIVLDVFGGSGSTLIACEKLNRNARVMELEPKWCQTIINRWEKLTGGKAEKIN